MTPLRPCFVRIPGSPGSSAAAVVAAGERARSAASHGKLGTQFTRALGLGIAALSALGGLGGVVAAEPAQRNGILAALSQNPPSRPVPIEAFYEVLRDHGTFIESDRYGVLFCPRPDEVGADFQPYLHGHWIMTEYGWTFTSDLKISWVTDHYGRWVEAGLQNCSWAWLPGGDWGPAWVDFRVGEKVIAWRPQLYAGPRVALRRPEAASFPRFNLPAANFSTPDSGYVAVRDGEFLSGRLDYVALTGVQLHSALRETEPLRNVRAGLASDERDRIIARIVERKAGQVAATTASKGGAVGSAGGPGNTSGTGAGDSFEPAQRRRKPGASAGAGATGVAGAAGTVRAGLPGAEPPKSGKGSEKLNLTGTQPGQTPPDRTNMSTGSSAGSPGQLSGAKILEWGKPQPPPKLTLPKPPPDPNSHTLAPEPGPAKKSPPRAE